MGKSRYSKTKGAGLLCGMSRCKAYSRTEQAKRCGNSVCPPLPAALVKANLPELCVAERTGNIQ